MKQIKPKIDTIGEIIANVKKEINYLGRSNKVLSIKHKSTEFAMGSEWVRLNIITDHQKYPFVTGVMDYNADRVFGGRISSTSQEASIALKEAIRIFQQDLGKYSSEY